MLFNYYAISNVATDELVEHRIKSSEGISQNSYRSIITESVTLNIWYFNRYTKLKILEI